MSVTAKELAATEECDSASGLPFLIVIVAVIAFICSAHYIANVAMMAPLTRFC